jgi:hypothetical protein
MNSLLALFPEYRKIRAEAERLREAVRDLQQEKLMLQDRLDSTMADRGKLWDLTRECINNERTAYAMQINAQWQKQGFGAPYPDAPKLPPSAEPSLDPVSGPARPRFASTRVAHATEQFIQDYVNQRT